MEPKRVIHRIGSVRSFDCIEAGLMLQTGRSQTELSRWCFVESIPGGDGGLEAKGSKFIGSEILFCQID